MKKCLLTILAMMASLTLIACDNTREFNSGNSNIEISKNNNINKEEYTEIRFSDMYETKGTEKNVSKILQNLDGKKVVIKGYPAVQSPLDESFIYLNNQPYVTCPFCTIGDITKLEVIPIFMADGSQIKYTEDTMIAYGTLEVEAKVDSEGYTTQFRIYADKIETAEATNRDKDVQAYYSILTDAGMIYDIQNLQMNIEYISNPEQMSYYGETKRDIVKGIIDEYLGYDEGIASDYGEGYSYLIYIEECPEIVEACEPEDERLKTLNNELIEIYNDEIKILKEYEKIVYETKDKELTDVEVENAYNAFVKLNANNLDLYNRFTAWNNKLRE